MIRRTMEVVPYNPNWIKEFEVEKNRINAIMEKEIIDIHHIGSTSIPGIYAKPVIDLLIAVIDIQAIDQYDRQMATLGYIPKGENGIKGRRFYLKGECKRTHHVHVFQANNPEIERHLIFRDYMIAHPEDAKAYEKLKKDLAAKFRYDNEGYCAGKNDFIQEMDHKAELWWKNSKKI
ncbi:GrpB family protein [Vallitalea okinawensis]|uniref:GrpB family protein n=1 Tax=Vallitalea okinawensis TaxID=2078660 RepID=UPI000CFB6710|nr:GrpB family protein [Vallitalea okinawensis]